MGGIGNIPIPLTYDENLIIETYITSKKTIFCSFVGSLTNQVREKMVKVLENKPDVFIVTNEWTNNIEEDNQTLYLKVMGKSRFTLAPRGYGKTSFRLYEALRMGSIPIYIYDEMWLPYQDIINWSKMAVLVRTDEMDGLYERLQNISDDEITSMTDYYKTYSHLFSYDGMCEYI